MVTALRAQFRWNAGGGMILLKPVVDMVMGQEHGKHRAIPSTPSSINPTARLFLMQTSYLQSRASLQRQA